MGIIKTIIRRFKACVQHNFVKELQYLKRYYMVVALSFVILVLVNVQEYYNLLVVYGWLISILLFYQRSEMPFPSDLHLSVTQTRVLINDNYYDVNVVFVILVKFEKQMHHLNKLIYQNLPFCKLVKIS